MSLLDFSLLFAFAFAAIYYTLKLKFRNRPPGPTPLPFIGNVLQLYPVERPEVLFTEWARQYGDVTMFTVFGKPTIILNTFEAAQDLLEKRGSLYSDRPRFVLFSELMGWQNASTHVRYGNRFRKHRKFIHPTFNQRAVRALTPIQEKQALLFAQGLIDTPDMMLDLMKRFATATIFKVTYGKDVTSVHDPFVRLMDEAGTLTTTSGTPAATLVDYFPVMKHIPLWAPFSDFKRNALTAKIAVDKMMNIPFEAVKNSMRSGDATPSMALSLLESCIRRNNGELAYEDEEDIKGVVGSLSSAASETTATVIETFVLAMVLHPNVLRKAQDEMDRVLNGSSGLPTFADRPALPYLECVLKETYRWGCPVPLGMPHRLMEDDVYRGFLLPKGATVLANISAMCQSYHEPDVFRPERWLTGSMDQILIDPKDYVFGFGRRICPGRYFADSSIWIAAASLVALFQIDKFKNSEGVVIEPVVKFQAGFIRRPLQFKCRICPRSTKAIGIIQRAVGDLDADTA